MNIQKMMTKARINSGDKHQKALRKKVSKIQLKRKGKMK